FQGIATSTWVELLQSPGTCILCAYSVGLAFRRWSAVEGHQGSPRVWDQRTSRGVRTIFAREGTDCNALSHRAVQHTESLGCVPVLYLVLPTRRPGRSRKK